MNKRQAYERAKWALERAHEANMRLWVQSGDGWGDWDSSTIESHVESYLAYAFGQGCKPADFPED